MDAQPSHDRESRSTLPFRVLRGARRVRMSRLLNELHELVGEWLQAPLQRTLDEFSNRLFKLAEHARDGKDLQAYMNSRETVLQTRSMIAERFTEGVRQHLDRIGEPPAEATVAVTNASLSLVAPAEQDMAATLEKLAARGIARGGPPLFELGYRLAALIGSPPLEGADHPLGPYALATAFHKAIVPLGLPDEHNVQLLASFDSTLLSDIVTLYEKANDHLLADGILPQLHAYKAPTMPGRTNPAPKTHAADEDPAPRRRDQHDADATPNEPIAVLDSLRELLAQRHSERPDRGGGPMATADELQTALGALQQHSTRVTEHASRELRSAQRLRAELLAQLNDGRPASSSQARLSGEQDDTIELIAMLFEQLATQAHQGRNTRAVLGGMQLPVLRMAVTDHDFFEQREHPARRLLDAITEAASDWLDAPGGVPDHGLEGKLEHLIKRASSEPPSAGLYTSLLADIEQHLGMLKLRAQAAERRHVEAVRAGERLDHARQRAAELMAERFAKSERAPHGLLRTLLDRVWTDVLALALLRHGEHGDACVAQLNITDQLLGLAPVTDRKQLQQDVQTGLSQIGMACDEAVQVALRLVAPEKKVRSNDAPSTTELLMRLKQHPRLGQQRPAQGSKTAARPRPPAKREPAVAAGATEPAQAKRRVPPAAMPAADNIAIASAPAKAPEPPTPGPTPTAASLTAAKAPHQPAMDTSASDAIDPRERSIRQRLDKLPFGTWFEFTDTANGRVTQRKLAWYSPMSGQALFVTRRGQRAGEVGLDTLARQVAMGCAREVPTMRDSVLDRAWRSLTGNLRRAGTVASSTQRVPSR